MVVAVVEERVSFNLFLLVPVCNISNGSNTASVNLILRLAGNVTRGHGKAAS